MHNARSRWHADPDWRVSKSFDVVVVGGGPAGLHASLTLAEAGLQTAIIDENPELGGQYFRRPAASVIEKYGDLRPDGAKLISQVRSAGVTCIPRTLVWGVEGKTLFTSGIDTSAMDEIAAASIVVATGAHEIALPCEGWTLIGVCTPGFALHLAHSDHVPVGNRVLVAGTGPFLLTAAQAMLDVGANVSAVVELNRPYRLTRETFRAIGQPRRILELGRYLTNLRRRRVPLMQGWSISRILGEARVNGVELMNSTRSTVMRIDADVVCMAHGFRPNSELPRLLGCQTRIAHFQAIPETDELGRSSVEGVYLAGEVMGVGGIETASVRGRLAAHAILEDRGIAFDSGVRDRLVRKSRQLNRHAEFLANLFQVPRSAFAAIPDDAIVCRCEMVSAGEVRRAAGIEWGDLHGTKALTRAGMGPCQGRECGGTIAALQATRSPRPPAFFNARMPIKPIRVPHDS